MKVLSISGTVVKADKLAPVAGCKGVGEMILIFALECVIAQPWMISFR